MGAFADIISVLPAEYRLAASFIIVVIAGVGFAIMGAKKGSPTPRAVASAVEAASMQCRIGEVEPVVRTLREEIAHLKDGVEELRHDHTDLRQNQRDIRETATRMAETLTRLEERTRGRWR